MNFDSGAIQRLAELRNGGGLAKAGISTSAGLVFYDLEAEAKLLYPVIAPIRKRMPRIGKREAGQGLAVHWNIITDPNSAGITSELGEGQRGGVLTPATAAKISTYHGIGFENAVTWEAEYAGEGYDDIRGIAQRTSLDSLILAEEPKLLWGNGPTGYLLGQPSAAPTGTGSATGGTLATGTTYYLYAVPLTLQGAGLTKKAGYVVTTVTRPNADGTTLTYNGGAGILSAASAAISVTSSTSVGSIAAAVAPVKGAAAYAWFVGSSAGAANAYFWGVSNICVVTITSLPSTGQTAAYAGYATDYSQNQYSFDGLITQALTSNGYYNSLAGATLSPDGANGCVEVDTVLKYFWDTYKTSPTRMYVGSQVMRDLTKCIANNGTQNGDFGMRINLENTLASVGALTGGSMIQTYVNKYCWGGAKPIPVELHPNMPDGYIFFDCEINPYPTANIPIARAVRTRRDYFMVAWPVVTRQWQNGIYADECLQVYIGYSMGLLADLGPGIT